MSGFSSESGQNVEIENSSARRLSFPIFQRLLSTDSSTSSVFSTSYNVNTVNRVNNGPNIVEIVTKTVELVITIVCTGLYSKGIQIIIQNSIESLIFPYVVFASFVIINTVIVLGFILGQKMPAILTRIIDTIGLTLFFIAASITALDFYEFTKQDNEAHKISGYMLLVQVCLSFCNSGLYLYDLIYGIQKAVAG